MNFRSKLVTVIQSNNASDGFLPMFVEFYVSERMVQQAKYFDWAQNANMNIAKTALFDDLCTQVHRL